MDKPAGTATAWQTEVQDSFKTLKFRPGRRASFGLRTIRSTSRPAIKPKENENMPKPLNGNASRADRGLYTSSPNIKEGLPWPRSRRKR
jgi:hypothetical protein